MEAVSRCLDELVRRGDTDLHIVDEVAYGRSRAGCCERLDEIARATVGQAFAELAALLADGRGADDLGIVTPADGLPYRVTVMPAGRNAVLRRVPVATPSA